MSADRSELGAIAEALRGAAERLERLASEPEEAQPERVSVAIPGSFHAVYNLGTGEIDSLTFTPSGSDAGYFGPAAEVLGNADNWREEMSADAAGLNVTDTDGPFWRAVQSALEPETFVRMSVDDGEIELSEADEERTSVAIGWEE